MKHYINTHPTLIEDLRIAASLLETKRPILAHSLSDYAADLQTFDVKTGCFPQLNENNHGYMMRAGSPAFSNLKAWQKEAFKYAEQFDGQIFTRSGIDNLAEGLRYVGSRQRNYPGDKEVRTPDWAFYERTGLVPSLLIGNGLSIDFFPIKGWYYIPTKEESK